MSRGKSNKASSSFNEEDRQLLQNINKTVKGLKEELKSLREELNKSKKDLKATKQALNLTNSQLDDLEQYGRRENIRIHNVAESTSAKDDGEDVLFKVADALKIKLAEYDIQRVHRIGVKKTSRNAKPRPVIVRFVSYQKRNEFLFEKSKLKKSMHFGNAFIIEDLTPLRSKLLR